MISTSIYFVLFLVAFFSYINKKYIPFLVCVFGMMSRLFLLDTFPDVIIKGDDFALVLFVALSFVVYSRDKNVFSVNKDPLTRWIYLFIALYVLEMIATVIVGRESLANSLKVIRGPLVILGFFVFKSIPIDNYKKFLKIIVVISFVQGFLYYLQYLGITVLTGGGHAMEEGLKIGVADGGAINIPTFTFFILYFLLEAKYLKEKKVYYFIFFLSLVFATFIRAWIVSAIIGFVYYVLFIIKSSKNGRSKRIILILALLFILLPLTMTIFKSKSEVRSSEEGAFSTIVSSGGDFSNLDTHSTMTFRFAMLVERWYFLFDNPQYLLTGVGTMHEDSPLTLSMFNFILGSPNEDRFLGRCVIESGDITWVPITLRYGLIGVLIHIMMFFVLFKNTRKRNDVLVILSSYAICIFLQTFDGAYFDRSVNVYMLSLFYAIVSRSNYENKPLLT